MSSGQRVIAVVPAAGFGRRFIEGTNKSFFNLGGRSVLGWVLARLELSPLVDEIMPVVKEADRQACEALVSTMCLRKVRHIVAGGKERQDSVYNALRTIRQDAGGMSGPPGREGSTDRNALRGDPLVLVHDGARPFLTDEVIARTIEGARGHDGAIAAVPPKDTIKESGRDAGGQTVVSATLNRDLLWSVQTPQVFPMSVLMRAYDRAYAEGFYATDDAALVEHDGGSVAIVMGAYENIKITTPEDAAVGELLLRRTHNV